MPYEIYPVTAKTFIEDRQIKLPRFQRKSTWKPKQRFDLVLSIFRDYPIGASIIYSETQSGGRVITKWLLDGRQRRETIQMLYSNPEHIYEWASRTFSLGDINSFSMNFYDYIDEFVQSEEDFDEGSDEPQQNEDENPNPPASPPVGVDYLSYLSKMIYIAKFKKGRSAARSGITHIFDFKRYLTETRTLLNQLYLNDFNQVDGAKLRTFIRQFVDRFNREVTFDNLTTFLEECFGFKENQQERFQRDNRNNWDDMSSIIKIYSIIDDIVFNSKIGIIDTKDVKAHDTQKIFHLINKGGTPLSASEIISAKSIWNVKVENIPRGFERAISNLYDQLGNPSAIAEGYVKWDIPASFYYYLEDQGIKYLFDFGANGDISRKISIGFKLLSGIHVNGVKKEDFDQLAQVMNYSQIDELIDKLKRFFNLFSSNPYLSTLKSWGQSLFGVTSEGVALNYTLLLYKHWIALGEPSAFQDSIKVFTKNSFILLDRFIYEYVTKQWRGSSDSKISRSLLGYAPNAQLFIPIEQALWNNLINGIIDDNTINQTMIAKEDLDPLVYFYNVLKRIHGDNSSAEVDHIIPKREWQAVALDNKDSIMNNLYNLSLLPNGINSAKNDQLLSTIEARQLPALNEILRYEEINASDIHTFSTPSCYAQMRSLRGGKIKEAYDQTRQSILVTP